ncbi:polysaccharide pyruvyl transferase family protein [Aneurinibacillus uraniidurans]|uniref:polysaccharide pyruvyl transferase family protein n=1 Tax=Aneurinibacillus uraniidurans TaxID=2966586 RepID=UPI00234999DF|nr:polysaccharide pyruvyl transferase family protein [Aneurinibacillus sp. B1]WCN38093.1 polysaccharide pyruvyl transferase family protein [Aneurinibacillus sp. B1]
MRIAQIGTFNVDNLGDLLFPIMLDCLLKDIGRKEKLDFEIDFFSPNNQGVSSFYDDQLTIKDLGRFETLYNDKNHDLIFVGGGDLVRFDDWSINNIYKKSELSFTQILSPFNISVSKFFSIGIGVPFEIREAEGLFLQNTFTRYKKISVRDEISKNELLKIGIESEIVPDIVITISRYFTKEQMGKRKEKKFSHRFPGKYLVFQASSYNIKDDEIRMVVQFLEEISRKLELTIVLLSIGECLGDNELLEKINELLPRSILVNRKEFDIELLDKVAVIAGADLFIGSSLHGNIISFSYNIPHITFVGEYSRKIQGFFSLVGNSMCFYTLRDLVSQKDKVINYTIKKCDNTVLLTDLFDSVKRFVMSAICEVKKGKYEDIHFSFSSEIDMLFKLSHKQLVDSAMEKTNLWQRVHNDEMLLEEYKRSNDELWQRVHNDEMLLGEYKRSNDELWQRVHNDEVLLEEYKQINEQLTSVLNKKENEINNLLKEINMISSSFLYYLKKKIKKG